MKLTSFHETLNQCQSPLGAEGPSQHVVSQLQKESWTRARTTGRPPPLYPLRSPQQRGAQKRPLLPFPQSWGLRCGSWTRGAAQSISPSPAEQLGCKRVHLAGFMQFSKDLRSQEPRVMLWPVRRSHKAPLDLNLGLLIKGQFWCRGQCPGRKSMVLGQGLGGQIQARPHSRTEPGVMVGWLRASSAGGGAAASG